MEGVYGPGALRAPGAGTGRPCFIAHDAAWPASECDGLHGSAAASFYELESLAVTGAVHRAMTGVDIGIGLVRVFSAPHTFRDRIRLTRQLWKALQ